MQRSAFFAGRERASVAGVIARRYSPTRQPSAGAITVRQLRFKWAPTFSDADRSSMDSRVATAFGTRYRGEYVAPAPHGAQSGDWR